MAVAGMQIFYIPESKLSPQTKALLAAHNQQKPVRRLQPTAAVGTVQIHPKSESGPTILAAKPVATVIGSKRPAPTPSPTESLFSVKEEVDVLLSSEEDGFSGGHPARKRANLDHLSPEERLQRRKLKNRVAAQTARDKKKAQMDDMEKMIERMKADQELLAQENKKLRESNNVLQEENVRLAQQNEELQARLRLVANNAVSSITDCPPSPPLSSPPSSPHLSSLSPVPDDLLLTSPVADHDQCLYANTVISDRLKSAVVPRTEPAALAYPQQQERRTTSTLASQPPLPLLLAMGRLAETPHEPSSPPPSAPSPRSDPALSSNDLTTCPTVKLEPREADDERLAGVQMLICCLMVLLAHQRHQLKVSSKKAVSSPRPISPSTIAFQETTCQQPNSLPLKKRPPSLIPVALLAPPPE